MINDEIETEITDDIIEALTKDLILSNLDDALIGKADGDSIRHLISQAADRIRNSNITPHKLKIHLAHALSQISRGMDANKAFGLKKGSRRKNDNGTERFIALQVWQLINKCKYPAKDAIRHIANTSHKSEETIKKIYYRHSDTIDSAFKKIKEL